MPDNSGIAFGGAVDKAALRRKYLEERDKRLRADGNEQYLRLEGRLAHYLEDPYTPLRPREPRTDHVTFAFIGGGFAGLATGARLVEAGIRDVRIVEKGGDFGGTWYWNRYPGAQCDTASMVYMPLLEETRHMPSEKYAHGPEILAHCQRIGRQYELYDRALFHTEVRDIAWDEARSAWLIRTDRGDAFTAQFVGIGTGPLHVPKLPGIRLASSRSAVIPSTPAAGTTATRVEIRRARPWPRWRTSAWPSSARVPRRFSAYRTSPGCDSLFVFQRTPSSVDVRANATIDPAWFASIATPGWQQRWLENFTANQAGGTATDDLVKDGWTDLSRRIRAQDHGACRREQTDRRRTCWRRSKIRTTRRWRRSAPAPTPSSTDRETAQKLKAWYRQLCKRPCFHDEYLQAFNAPNTKLVDTDGKGVERITERGVVVAAGAEYRVDCIIYASGFEVGTEYRRRAGFELSGRDGLKLSERWGQGMRTKHGIHVHGFPNAFFVQPTQGANLISNVPHNLTEAGQTIAAIVRHALEVGAREVEVTKEAEDAWVALLLSGPGMLLGSQDCTPGYYNNEGQDLGLRAKLNVGYPAGAQAYFRYLDEWRRSGRFDGLEFRTA